MPKKEKIDVSVKSMIPTSFSKTLKSSEGPRALPILSRCSGASADLKIWFGGGGGETVISKGEGIPLLHRPELQSHQGLVSSPSQETLLLLLRIATVRFIVASVTIVLVLGFLSPRSPFLLLVPLFLFSFSSPFLYLR